MKEASELDADVFGRTREKLVPSLTGLRSSLARLPRTHVRG